jgi:hypothetical protein
MEKVLISGKVKAIGMCALRDHLALIITGTQELATFPLKRELAWFSECPHSWCIQA